MAPAAQAVSWSPPQQISRSERFIDSVRLGSNARGEAVCAYLSMPRRDVSGDSLTAVRRSARGRITHRQSLDLGTAYDPSVAIDPDGRAFVAWSRENPDDDTDYDIVVAEAPPGKRFGRPEVVADGILGRPDGLQMARAGGQTIVAYNESSSIMISARKDGGQFGEPRRFDYTFADPKIAVSPSGDALVSWLGTLEPQRRFSSRRLVGVPITGGVVGERQAMAPTGRASALEVLLGARGRVTALWQGSDPQIYASDREFGPIKFARGRIDRAFAGPGFVSRRVGTSRRSGPQYPSAAAGADDSVLTAWHEIVHPADNTFPLGGAVYASQRTGSGRFSGPRRLSRSAAISTFPSVAVNGRSTGLVVWSEAPRDSLTFPRKLVAAERRAGRFSSPHAVTGPGERVTANVLRAHRDGFLVAYLRARGKRADVYLRESR
jgi:hypothetical protein